MNRFNELDADTQKEFWEAFKNEYFGPDNSYILDILPKVILLKQMNFVFAFGNRCSEAYCRKVREDVIKEFDS